MTHGSLFSGIGGFDLAAEWMGWENVFHVEINKFCQQVLKHYWPNAKLYEDITKTDFREWAGKIDIVTGGFPCQPYSQAGKRKGKEDDRHLWPEMLRAIREIQPAWVVGENVPGLLNWERGLVLAEIKADLEAAGFEVFPPVILPACGKNAPHRRDRLWIVANDKSKRTKEKINEWGKQEFNGRKEIRDFAIASGEVGIIANAEYRRCKEQWDAGTFKSNPTVPSIEGRVESRFRGGNDGLPRRVDRLESLGNAIVPQIAYEIFKAIECVDNIIT